VIYHQNFTDLQSQSALFHIINHILALFHPFPLQIRSVPWKDPLKKTVDRTTNDGNHL
jgi:hypothetical protein